MNIIGNDITNETAIRNLLIVDEGDPLNEILNNKSINNIKGSGLFSKVDYKILDTNNEFKKDIEIQLRNSLLVRFQLELVTVLRDKPFHLVLKKIIFQEMPQSLILI